MATSKSTRTQKAKKVATASTRAAAPALTLTSGRDRKPGEPVMVGTKTLTDIHKKTGLTLSYLSRVFRARKTPRIETLNKIAGAAGISAGALLDALNGLEKPKPGKARKAVSKGKAKRGGKKGKAKPKRTAKPGRTSAPRKAAKARPSRTGKKGGGKTARVRAAKPAPALNTPVDGGLDAAQD